MKRVFVLVTRHLSPVTFLLVTACRAIALATAGHLSLITSVIAADPPITEQELVRRTQELYDSIVAGNQTPWKKYFADDCTFSDEKGRTLDKTKLVADITPLPKGYSGAIKIVNVISRIIGDTAILSYDANETETIFGQNLRARYHITDTWLRRNGQWQIIASQAHRYYEDPAISKADGKNFPILSVVTNSRPDKPEPSRLRTENYSSNATAKKKNCSPRRPICFSARGSKAGFYFVMTRMPKWMFLSTV